MLIKCRPSVLWLPGVAEQWPSCIWELWQNSKRKGYWLEESVLLLNVTFLTCVCLKSCINEYISDSNRLGVPKGDVNWLRILHWKYQVYSGKMVVFIISLTNFLSCELEFSFYWVMFVISQLHQFSFWFYVLNGVNDPYLASSINCSFMYLLLLLMLAIF